MPRFISYDVNNKRNFLVKNSKLGTIEVIAEAKLSNVQRRQLDSVMSLAKKDKYLLTDKNDWIREGEVRKAIICEEVVVGFISPKRQMFHGSTHWRAGALYVTPQQQGKGIMSRVLHDFFTTHSPGLTWIDDSNRASISVFRKLGFIMDKARNGKDGEPGHWYYLPKGSLSLTLESTTKLPAYIAWQ